MGTFIHEMGALTIPDNKRENFLKDAEIIARQGGLFDRNYISAFGKELYLLSFPSFDNSNAEYIDFSYSYFEDDCWENAGIDRIKITVYSNKVGWRSYNKAVQALYILAELYSISPYISYNDSLNCPVAAIQWLRYVMKRELHYSWRNHIWEIMEMRAKHLSKYMVEPVIDERFFQTFAGDESDTLELLSAATVLYDYPNTFSEEDRKAALQKKEGFISYDNALVRLQQGIAEYKKTSALTDEEQISFLMELLNGFDANQDKARFEKYISVIVSMTILPPQASVKVMADAYGINFWRLWWQIKDRIHTASIELSKPPEANRFEEMTTECFFNIGSENRLYWWRKDGDVELSEESKNWLRKLSLRHCEINKETIPGDMTGWQKRFVKLLSEHPKIYCFEELFFEFMGRFNENEIRAAVILLEENTVDLSEYRRLMAVLANRKLRYSFFLF